MIHEDRDTALLSLFKSVLQSAPQATLQIFLIASEYSHAGHIENEFLGEFRTNSVNQSSCRRNIGHEGSLASAEVAVNVFDPIRPNPTRLDPTRRGQWNGLELVSITSKRRRVVFEFRLSNKPKTRSFVIVSQTQHQLHARSSMKRA